MTKKPKKSDHQKTSLSLPKELWRETHIVAMDQGRDFQSVVADALRAYLKKQGGRKHE